MKFIVNLGMIRKDILRLKTHIFYSAAQKKSKKARPGLRGGQSRHYCMGGRLGSRTSAGSKKYLETRSGWSIMV